MKYFVTGGAGFIGSTIVDRLLELGNVVVAFDNFSTGNIRFLDLANKSPNFTLIKGDLLNIEEIRSAIKGSDFVFHMAANADVRNGINNTKKDFEQNTLATFNLLEAMRLEKVHNIAFASTGSVYGEPNIFPTPETAPFPVQTSLYGASKLACEGLIAAFCEGFGFKGWIFRFVSILGERYSHGHIFDFYKKLLNDSSNIEILGDGHQKKSYLYVHDCIDAMLIAISKSQDRINIFNLGTDEYIEVNDSLDLITETIGVSPKRKYSGGIRGWAGDSPFIFLDTAKIRSLGWAPKFSIKEGIERTVAYLKNNQWILKGEHFKDSYIKAAESGGEFS